MEQYLNEVLWMALIAGMIVNWSTEGWHFSVKEVLGNIVIVGLAWTITEYILSYKYGFVPQAKGWQIVYVVGACIFAFSPIEMFRTIKSGGRDSMISWFRKQADKYSKKETTIEVKKTETVTEEPKP